jgi:putative MATE family efflux protein
MLRSTVNKSANGKQKALFERTAIPKAVAILSVPTVISQLITVIYNLADTYFVGEMNDPYQLSAINVCLPLMLMFTALANLFGIGGSGALSRALGRGDTDTARRISSFAVYGGIAVSLAYSAIVLAFSEPILYAMGADGYTFSYAYDYMIYVIVIGGVFTAMNPLLAHLVRSEGRSLASGFGMSLGAVINIILDPIMITSLGLGIVGAAVATLIGNACACLFFVACIISSRKRTVISLVPMKISLKAAIDVLLTGLPNFFLSMLSSVSNTATNNLIVAYDTVALAGVGIAKKINLTAFAVTQGISQGVLPLIGYNYAQGNKKRMNGAILFAGAVTGVISLVLMTVALTASGSVVSLFIKDASTVEYGSNFLRIICLAMPTSAFIFLSITYFQATGRKTFPLILSFLRKGTLDIIFMLTLNSAFGMYGVLWATPAAEVTASVVTAVMLVSVILSNCHLRRLVPETN